MKLNKGSHALAYPQKKDISQWLKEGFGEKTLMFVQDLTFENKQDILFSLLRQRT
jgi:hypothetical protein